MRWIEQARPTVYVLTAGSRSGTSRSRVEASRQLAQQLGAKAGEIFGPHLDREVYDWILAGEVAPFQQLARDLSDSFIARAIGQVVTDSWQLYNAVHDLWHVTVRCAAQDASRRSGRVIEVLDYPVVPQGMVVPQPGPTRLCLDLTDAEMARKHQLADAFPEIADDLAELLQVDGPALLARESLHALRPLSELAPGPGQRPLYETYGEARVATGLYGQVLRWQHVEPIVASLAAVTV